MLTPADHSIAEPTTPDEFLRADARQPDPVPSRRPLPPSAADSDSQRLDHLRALEAESLQIIREVAAEFARPVMLYSIGKDSSVMLRLAQKAFYPAPIPFPLLHVDTTYKFREMISFRDEMAKAVGARLIVHTNEEAIGEGTQPFKVGTQRCCGLLKTKSLLD